MFRKDEFFKYAVKHLGMSSYKVEDYARYNVQALGQVQNMTPYIIEER